MFYNKDAILQYIQIIESLKEEIRALENEIRIYIIRTANNPVNIGFCWSIGGSDAWTAEVKETGYN